MQYVSAGNRQVKKKSKITVGYIVLLLAVVIFLVRAVGVVNSYRERGGLAYVQLLNFSMPVVENQIYDSSAYRENKVTLKRVIKEALGLNNITTYGIVGSEITLFKNISMNTISNNSGGASKLPFSIFTPYEVKEDSIAKMTDKDVAELNTVSAAYDPSLKQVLQPSNFKVLIYHTHTHEGYSEVNGSSEDENFTVVGVGDVLAKELEDGYGVSVIHDKTIHDTAPYAESYLRSEPTVQKYLDEFGSFDLIIDIHRDGGPAKEVVTTNLNGQDLAKVLFVTSQNSPNYNSMMEKVNSMIDISNRLFPSLLKGNGLYEYDMGSNTFNQKLSPNSVLIEFGADTNTAQEAKLSSKYVARIIAEYLKTKN